MIIYGKVEDRVYKTLVISRKNKLRKPFVQDNHLVISDKFEEGDIRLLVSRVGLKTEFDAFKFDGEKWVSVDTMILPMEHYRIKHAFEMKWLFSIYKTDVEYPGLSRDYVKVLKDHRRKIEELV